MNKIQRNIKLNQVKCTQKFKEHLTTDENGLGEADNMIASSTEVGLRWVNPIHCSWKPDLSASLFRSKEIYLCVVFLRKTSRLNWLQAMCSWGAVLPVFPSTEFFNNSK